MLGRLGRWFRTHLKEALDRKLRDLFETTVVSPPMVLNFDSMGEFKYFLEEMEYGGYYISPKKVVKNRGKLLYIRQLHRSAGYVQALIVIYQPVKFL